MKKYTEAAYLYKCRMCGKIYEDSYSGIDYGWQNLLYAIHKISINNQLPLAMQTVHHCKIGTDKETTIQAGIADLIGMRLK